MNTADVELLRKNTECKKVKKRERGMVGGKKKSFLDDLKTSKSSKR